MYRLFELNDKCKIVKKLLVIKEIPICCDLFIHPTTMAPKSYISCRSNTV